MKLFRHSHRWVTPQWVVLLALLGIGSGCKNPFVPKHKVLVDAITAADAPKPSGLSYRLIAKRSVVSQTPVQIPVVRACVDAALSGQGMFEPPANTPPDVFIEVGYGRDNSPRADPSARETFLQLSARSNPQRALDRPSGPELWDVKVSILGAAGSVENAMPLLAAVAGNYLAANTKLETKIEVPQNSPMVEAVRSSAIKALEAQATGGEPPPARPAVKPAAAAPTGAVPGGTAAR
jgi:hypothetical protein